MGELGRRRLLQLIGGAGLGTGAGLLTPGVAAAAPAPDAARGAASLRTRLTQQYGITYPIVNAGMAFYATPELAAAVTNAGGLGCLGPMPETPEGMRKQIQETRALTKGPFGVDFVYFPLANSTLYTPGYEADDEHMARNATWSVNDLHIDVVIEEKVDFVVWYWTKPEARWVRKLKDAKIPQWAQVGSVAGALEAAEYGAEVLIAQGKQGGGHVRGFQDGDPLHRSELVPMVRKAVPKNVLVLGSGGIADGRTLANALSEGADGGWVGTRFAVSKESFAHPEYMRRVIAVKDGWSQTTPTAIFGPEFPHAYTRSIVNRVLTEWKGKEDQIPVPPPPAPFVGTARLMPWTVPGGIPYAMPKFSVIIPTRLSEGDFDEMCLLAGSESSEIIDSVEPAGKIVRDMATEAAAILGRKRR
ncbi:enoyl-[acyl-carrier-protein] reductase FabK [Sporichthya brevicatena]|uniref:Enoyl-[acyl-carrier-protein] reductase FabK n=1 Tax=Sporichthya brevicatena TaxID=171442 RepID=A0ABN1GPX9_9ACTN